MLAVIIQRNLYIKPCFGGDEIENTCSESSDFCNEKLGTKFKLVRLDGIKVKYYKNYIYS